MYPVPYNPYEHFYYVDHKGFHYIGNKNMFIYFLMRGFRLYTVGESTHPMKCVNNIYCYCEDILTPYMPCGMKATDESEYSFARITLSPIEFYDAAMRKIQPSWYIVEAFNMYLKWLDKEIGRRAMHGRKLCIKVFKFRQGPVEGIHKTQYRGYYRRFGMGKQSQIMRSDPTFWEECGFERGHKSEYNAWIVEKFRHTDRSWKSSKKCKHQWEKNLSSKKKVNDR